MTRYSDDELERMLADLESDLSERKESLRGDAPTKSREAICAFANDVACRGKPGVLFIGANDDGSPSGLPITDKLILALGAMKSDGNIVPPPTLDVEKRRLRGHDMAVVTVQPSDSPPVRYKGRIRIRVGSRRDIATAQDERVLNEKRRHRDRPFDVQPVREAAIDDLDLTRFESEYLPAAVARDILDANDRTPEQRLAATKMVVGADEPTPTVLGLLVLGKRTRSLLPGAYVQFLRYEGTDQTGPVGDELLIDGTVGDILRRLDEKLAAHNRVRVDFTSQSQEERTSLYPKPALEQITRNAILHRTYEGTNAPVRVTWYDDRLEITSPGGPFGEVTRENFGTPGASDYRNPSLAEALKVLGYAQKFGGGIAVAQSAMAKNGNPPIEFQVDPGLVMAVLKRRP